MSTSKETSIGSRFREVHSGMFGQPGLEWVVGKIFTGSDRLEYVRLVSASDATEQKTLSVWVLQDVRRFTRLS